MCDSPLGAAAGRLFPSPETKNRMPRVRHAVLCGSRAPYRKRGNSSSPARLCVEAVISPERIYFWMLVISYTEMSTVLEWLVSVMRPSVEKKASYSLAHGWLSL